jgi:hypothetical protein
MTALPALTIERTDLALPAADIEAARRRQPPARPTGATSPCSAHGARARASAGQPGQPGQPGHGRSVPRP